MSRVTRVPYHQNVYDLLQIEPGESPEAARMIAEHEATHGSLPASVREWYLVPNVGPLVAVIDADPDRWWITDSFGQRLPNGTRPEEPYPLAEVLRAFA